MLCPEEFSMLKNRALQTAKFFFDKMALEGKKLLIHLYNAKIALTDDLYPSKAAELLLNNDRAGFRPKIMVHNLSHSNEGTL